LLATAATVACYLAGALAAHADAGYASHGQLGHFSRFRVPEGAIEGSIPFGDVMSGLALSPTGDLFGVVAPDPISGAPPRLARLLPDTAQLEFRGWLAVQSSGVSPDYGLAFDATGRLWLSTSEGLLYQVDPADGAVELRSDLGMPLMGLAGCGRTLFSLTQPLSQPLIPTQLVRIDPDQGTHAILGAGTSAIYANGGAGLDFSSDGRLWSLLQVLPIIGGEFSYFVELDPASGELLHNQITASFNGLALAPPPASCPGRGVVEVPGLGAAGLALLGLLLGSSGVGLLAAAKRGSARGRRR
jgi:hypothetical protein